MAELEYGYSGAPAHSIRQHSQSYSESYSHPSKNTGQNSPTGVDVIKNNSLVQRTFPSYDKSIETLIHVRRAGSIDSQQLGQYMLEIFKAANGVRLSGKVTNIDKHDGFTVYVDDDKLKIKANRLINAAGPFLNEIAVMLGTKLPVTHTLQQKIAFEDTASVIPRDMPFSIDLDGQFIDWNEEERALLQEDIEYARYSHEMPGAIHCRPDGDDHGRWVKLGWAYNNTASVSYFGPELYDESDSFVVGAMSGFGTMAACASGELCAQHVLDLDRPDYSFALSPQRYSDVALWIATILN